jgi:hypothetical protein
MPTPPHTQHLGNRVLHLSHKEILVRQVQWLCLNQGQMWRSLVDIERVCVCVCVCVDIDARFLASAVSLLCKDAPLRGISNCKCFMATSNSVSWLQGRCQSFTNQSKVWMIALQNKGSTAVSALAEIKWISTLKATAISGGKGSQNCIATSHTQTLSGQK